MVLHPRSMIDMAMAMPTFVEPLPLYTRRPVDPETSSIRSAAPSYRSEAPTYHMAPVTAAITTHRADSSANTIQRGLPAIPPRAREVVGDIANHNYDITRWSNVRSSGTARQYENVARRRMERNGSYSGLLNSIPDLALLELSLDSATSRTFVEPSSSMQPAMTPLSPREDPELVGEAAARIARDQRLYRERCQRGNDILIKEDKAWDFMLGQMSDWEEREQSWNNFRTAVGQGRRQKLAKRIGAMQWRR